MNNTLIQQKLRQKILKKRRRVPSTTYEEASLRICSYIKNLPLYQQAKSIALYHPFNNEINIASLFIPNHPVQSFYYPKIEFSDLRFIAINSDTVWHANKYGILEPMTTQKFILPQPIDLVIVPLVAFDTSGSRIGSGKGFYDKALAHIQTQTIIGVAYEFQKLASIPRNSWDIPLDAVITETTHYHCKEQLCQSIIG